MNNAPGGDGEGAHHLPRGRGGHRGAREILRTTKINKSTHAACQIVPFEPLIPKLFLFCTYDDSFPCR